MDLDFDEVNPNQFLAAIQEVENYGAVMTSRSSTAGRCVSLAFTKLQEARHWVEQEIVEKEQQVH